MKEGGPPDDDEAGLKAGACAAEVDVEVEEAMLGAVPGDIHGWDWGHDEEVDEVDGAGAAACCCLSDDRDGVKGRDASPANDGSGGSAASSVRQMLGSIARTEEDACDLSASREASSESRPVITGPALS